MGLGDREVPAARDSAISLLESPEEGLEDKGASEADPGVAEAPAAGSPEAEGLAAGANSPVDSAEAEDSVAVAD